jgi:NAD(P)-dependent dehydrogenase (short-subunit alcohol dehydrogenase family)
MNPVCLITGAGGRLGSHLCASLAGRYRIVAAYHGTPPDVASQLARPIDPALYPWEERSAREVHCVQADLTRREDIRRLVEVAVARFGRIDALVNNAADLRFHGRLREVWQADDYPEDVLALNAIAPMRLASAVFDACWKQDRDRNVEANRSVLNISSTSGLQVFKTNEPFYAASKAALNMLTLHLAVDLATYGVRVNALCAGRFDDEASTARVGRAVLKLLGGDANASIVNEEAPPRTP